VIPDNYLHRCTGYSGYQKKIILSDPEKEISQDVQDRGEDKQAPE